MMASKSTSKSRWRPRPLTAAEVAEWVRVSMAVMLSDEQLAAWRGASQAHGAQSSVATNPEGAAAECPRHFLDLPQELLQRVAEATAAREYGALSRACTASRTAAAGAFSVAVAAEVARRLKAGEQVCNRICRVCPTLVLPAAVASVGVMSFWGCRSLTSIVLPEGLTSVDNQAFQACTALTSIVLPASCTRVGDRAFYCCRSLTSIILPTSLTEIGAEAFTDCESLTTITIPDKVEAIGLRTFQGCTTLSSVNLNASLEFINGEAFKDCRALQSITIPASATLIIIPNAFVRCFALDTPSRGRILAICPNAVLDRYPFVPPTYDDFVDAGVY